MTDPARVAPTLTASRFFNVLLLGTIAAVVSMALSVAVGAESVDVLGVLSGKGSAVDKEIFLSLRVPRVLLAALVGAALGVCGAAYQALLRNPLAEPYLLGVSGGGSLGAVIAIVLLGPTASAVLGVRAAAALVGCLGALALVYAVASRGGGLHPSTLLLAGVVTNSFFLAGLACVQYLATPHEAQAILRWVMGGLAGQGVRELVLLAIALPIGGVLLLRDAASLNLLAFGEESARYLGVSVDATRRRVFIITSLLVAASVAVSGPIGFVGLFVPHAARFLVGGDQRLLLPASLLAGAAFLPLADAFARVALAPRELPVGIVTAVVGAPAFVLLLLRHRSAQLTAGGGGAGA